MTQAIQARQSPRLQTGWGWVLALGLVLAAGGVLALVSPKLTTFATAIYVGITLLFAGTFGIVGGLANIGQRGGWLVALLGGLSLLFGIVLAFDPFAGAISLVWAIGLWIFVGGVFELAAAFSLASGRGWLILVAIVDLVLGGLIMTMKPESALDFLTFFVSASLLIRGIWTISLAMDLRQLSRL